MFTLCRQTLIKSSKILNIRVGYEVTNKGAVCLAGDWFHCESFPRGEKFSSIVLPYDGTNVSS